MPLNPDIFKQEVLTLISVHSRTDKDTQLLTEAKASIQATSTLPALYLEVKKLHEALPELPYTNFFGQSSTQVHPLKARLGEVLAKIVKAEAPLPLPALHNNGSPNPQSDLDVMLFHAVSHYENRLPTSTVVKQEGADPALKTKIDDLLGKANRALDANYANRFPNEATGEADKTAEAVLPTTQPEATVSKQFCAKSTVSTAHTLDTQHRKRFLPADQRYLDAENRMLATFTSSLKQVTNEAEFIALVTEFRLQLWAKDGKYRNVHGKFRESELYTAVRDLQEGFTPEQKQQALADVIKATPSEPVAARKEKQKLESRAPYFLPKLEPQAHHLAPEDKPQRTYMTRYRLETDEKLLPTPQAADVRAKEALEHRAEVNKAYTFKPRKV